MNFTITTIPKLLCLLITFILIQSCKIEKIKEEFSPDTNDFSTSEFKKKEDAECKITLIGKVIDSKTCDPISEAKITLNDKVELMALTGVEGTFEFSLTLDDAVDEVPPKLTITKDGYTVSQIIFPLRNYFKDGEDCDDRENCFACIDFFLTPQSAEQHITYLWGEWFENDIVKSQVIDADDCITNYHVNIPEHTVAQNVQLDMTYTPIDPRQYFNCGGLIVDKNKVDDDLDINGFKRIEPIVGMFEGKPDHQPFLVPLELDFVPSRDIPANAIFHCYFFDEEINKWVKDPGAVIQFIDGRIHYEIDKLACDHIITYTLPDPVEVRGQSPIQILEDWLEDSGDFVDWFQIGNCNCNKVKIVDDMLEKERVTENLWSETDMDSKSLEILLNDLRRQLCIPAKTTADILYSDISIPGSRLDVQSKLWIPIKGFKLEQCENIEVVVIEKVRSIKGTYKGVNFHYNAVVDICVKKTANIDCPVTSACHQGCPH